jgi:HlyD family secretion protein
LKKLLVVLLLLSALFSAAAYGLTAWSNRTLPADVYTLAPVEYGRVAEVISATGLVQPRDTFVVGTELSSKVVGVYADFNQTIEEGDVLLQLDDRVAREQLKQAELGVDLARVALKRAEADRQTAEIALRRERQRAPEVRREVDVDLAESQLKSARAAVEAATVKIQEAEEAQRRAESALRLTTVRAPVLASGVEDSTLTASLDGTAGIGSLAGESGRTKTKRLFLVLDRKISLNQQVGPPASAQLFTLARDLEHMQVHAKVVEGDVNKITRGLPVEFTVSGAGDSEPTFHGKVEDIRLTPVSDHGAVYYKVIIDVRNERNPDTGEWHLRPGLTASVDILRRVHEQTWKVPAAALSFQPEAGILTEEARAKLARWKDVKSADQWKPVWVVGTDGKPWPIFVRIGGQDAHGQTAVQDVQFTEVLQWEPELEAKPDPKDPATFPRLIIGMSVTSKSGLFNPPNVKF